MKATIVFLLSLLAVGLAVQAGKKTLLKSKTQQNSYLPVNTEVYIYSKQSGKVLNVYGSSTADSAAIIIWPQEYSANERFLSSFFSKNLIIPFEDGLSSLLVMATIRLRRLTQERFSMSMVAHRTQPRRSFNTLITMAIISNFLLRVLVVDGISSRPDTQVRSLMSMEPALMMEPLLSSTPKNRVELTMSFGGNKPSFCVELKPIRLDSKLLFPTTQSTL